MVAGLAGVVELDPAGEVLEPVRGVEPGVALEVEPDVARARLREEVEPAVVLEVEELDLVLAGLAVVELKPSLLPKPVERRGAHARDLGLGGLRQLSERGDPGRFEPLDLKPRNAGDEREVIVGVPALLAEREKVAEPAEGDRVGVDVGALVDRSEEPGAEPPVVGGEVLRAEALGLADPGDDVHRGGLVPLDPSDLLGVEAELKHVSRLGVASELGVDDLVAVGRRDHEVGEPAPVAFAERGLVDDVGLVVDRALGLGHGAIPVAVVEVDRGDRRGPRQRAARGTEPRARPPCAE